MIVISRTLKVFCLERELQPETQNSWRDLEAIPSMGINKIRENLGLLNLFLFFKNYFINGGKHSLRRQLLE
jgi:hypothetical protein